MPPPCKHRVCLLAGLLSCLNLCASCATPDALADINASPCRHLLSEELSFTEVLGSESPAAHVLETYESQVTTQGVVEWLFTSFRDGAEGGGDDEEEEDGRRRLTSVSRLALPDSDLATSKHRRALKDGDADDDDEEGGVQLSLTELQTAVSSAGTDEERVAAALQIVSACQLDADCSFAGEDDVGDDDEPEDLDNLKIGLAFGILGIALIGTFIPLIARSSVHFMGWLDIFNALAGAVFLTIGLVHLIPDTQEWQEDAAPDVDLDLGLVFAVIGFLTILFVEHILFDQDAADSKGLMRAAAAHKDGQELTGKQRWLMFFNRFRGPLLTEFALCIHAVLEAIAVGVAETRESALVIFSAIALHKGFAAMSVSVRFLRRGASAKQLFFFVAPFVFLAPLALIITTVADTRDPFTDLVLSGLATGTFIYIGAFEIVAEEFLINAVPMVPAEGTDASSEGSEQVEYTGWKPSKMLKFAAFTLMSGGVMGILAAIPDED